MRNHPDTFGFRVLVIFALLAVPFFRMLLADRYGFFYLEVLAAALLLLAASAAIAAASRNAWVFLAVVTAIITLQSVHALQADFLPSTRLRWLLMGLASGCLIGWWLLRQNFYRILLIFMAGAVSVDLLRAVAGLSSISQTTRAAERPELHHTLHIVLDEMIGLGAIPRQYEECAIAAGRMRHVLEAGAFEIYPNAFSNYRSTRDSIPSILNGRLLRRTSELVPDDGRRPVLQQNRYFDAFRSRGYAIHVYQSDYLMFVPEQAAADRVRSYRTNNLGALHAAPLPWTSRLRGNLP